MNYGYIRVSSIDQCEDRQWLALKQFDIPANYIKFKSFDEKV